MYSIDVLQRERDTLKEGDERIDDLDQSIIALQLIYDPNPKSKIITREKLERYVDDIANIVMKRVDNEATVLTIIEDLKGIA